MFRQLSSSIVAIAAAVVINSTSAVALDPFASAFSPLPDLPQLSAKDSAKVELGKALYLDTILSESRKISCSSCHRLDKFGVDNEPTSPGHNGKRGDRNSPSSFNAALHISQFWDGRAADVEEQALGPVLNSVEMAMPSEAVVMQRLKESENYAKLFKAAFPDEANPLSFKNVGRAIGAFERRLITPGKFDKYLKGDETALSAAEKKGLEKFVQTGCIGCHAGALVGGQMYQKLGLVKPYPTNDLGRFNVTKKDEDKFFFKVPSLRNVEKTGPYFHDGSVKTIEEAVQLMGRHQLGRELSAEDVSSIVTFLHALTGEVPQI